MLWDADRLRSCNGWTSSATRLWLQRLPRGMSSDWSNRHNCRGSLLAFAASPHVVADHGIQSAHKAGLAGTGYRHLKRRIMIAPSSDDLDLVLLGYVETMEANMYIFECFAAEGGRQSSSDLPRTFPDRAWFGGQPPPCPNRLHIRPPLTCPTLTQQCYYPTSIHPNFPCTMPDMQERGVRPARSVSTCHESIPFGWSDSERAS